MNSDGFPQEKENIIVTAVKINDIYRHPLHIHFDEIIKVKRGSNSLTNSYKTAVTICKS
jgi:hypothetical protein